MPKGDAYIMKYILHAAERCIEALDKVRKSEYARLDGKARRFIKAKSTICCRAMTILLSTATLAQNSAGRQQSPQHRLLPKESFGQLWDYGREGWARCFFDNWRASLKWQRLEPYERFADSLPAASPDVERKALGETRIVRQKIQLLELHGAAAAACNAPHFEFQNDLESGTRQVANPTHTPVVPAFLDPAAAAADGFFEHRSRMTIRTSGSPKTPRTVSCARNPANEYPSDRRRCRLLDLAIPHRAKFMRHAKRRNAYVHKRFPRLDPSKSPTRFPEDPNFFGGFR